MAGMGHQCLPPRYWQEWEAVVSLLWPRLCIWLPIRSIPTRHLRSRRLRPTAEPDPIRVEPGAAGTGAWTLGYGVPSVESSRLLSISFNMRETFSLHGAAGATFGGNVRVSRSNISAVKEISDLRTSEGVASACTPRLAAPSSLSIRLPTSLRVAVTSVVEVDEIPAERAPLAAPGVRGHPEPQQHPPGKILKCSVEDCRCRQPHHTIKISDLYPTILWRY